MIRIRKTTAPKKLAKNGVAKTHLHCTEYDLDREKYLSGQKKFEIDNTIYGNKCVKEALKQSHFNKCCYCESIFSGTSPGHTEHFRPKRGVKQSDGNDMKYPGYYWLAYSWDNLYYSCAECNRNKGNLFPLADDSKRARDHYGNIKLECPLIVDPGGTEDPRNHIGFHQEVPVGKTERGRITIKTLCLRRSGLNEKRKEHLVELKRIRDAIEIFSPKSADDPDALQFIQKAEDFLDSVMRACAEFSSMAQDLLAEEQ